METYKINDIKEIEKVFIFDSSSVITLNMINMLEVLYKLKENFNGDFLVTSDVFEEIVNVPLGIKKYKLRALLIKKAIKDNIFKVIKDEKLKEKTNEILKRANSMFKAHGEYIKIIHKGEASCIGLWDLIEINKKALIVDERTTRMLLEKPENLKKLLESKLHTKIEMNKENATYFTNKAIPVIRSTEILFVAFNRNKIDITNGKKQILDALLYAAKSYGCSISKQEIEKLKREIEI